MHSRIPLPIDQHLPEIVQRLVESPCLILQAPPGSGKTTRVAPALIESIPPSSCIALVQPRRIAARAAAARIAQERQTPLGSEVGYQVRFDARLDDSTRLISMTPGILLRRLHSDPLLESFSTVFLDEFHERSQELDLLLGMLRQLQLALRPELRLVVMSATMDCQPLADYLARPPILQVDGTMYPVDIRHARFEPPRPGSPSRRLVESTVSAVERVCTAHGGDSLVFLPGVGEIMQVQRRLESLAAKLDCDLLPLFGDMSLADQQRVIQPSPRRRIILATNIAETSLTIEGVRIVVDSGWARVKRFDPTTGLDALRLEPISKASAHQRAGRAGRTAAGICFRLWDEITSRSRPEQLEPEVLRADLAGTVLQLLSWGETPESFRWLTPPSTEAVARARQLLHYLGAVEGDRLTEMGRLLLKFPLHPRLGRLLVETHRLGVPQSAAMAAALLSERDLFSQPASSDRPARGRSAPPTQHARSWGCDVTARVDAWRSYRETGQSEFVFGTIHRGAARNLERVSQQFLQITQQALGPCSEQSLDNQLSQALLAAFPDRLALRRGANTPRAVMVGGKGVKLETASGVREELFLCLDVDAGTSEARVRLASGIDRDWLPDRWLRQADELFFSPTQQAVVSRRRVYWLDLLLSETPIATALDENTARLLSQVAAQQFERLLPAGDKQLHSLLGRLRWLSTTMPHAQLPSLTGQELADQLLDWCFGKRSLEELKQLPWQQLIEQLLTHDQRQLLDQQAPQSLRLPTGRTVLLQYEPGRAPVLAARIQELFGWSTTPRLAEGRVPLTLHLLAPNGRCQQITDDLASFWRNTYPTVRKELRGRYPKHAWPEDPLHPA